MRILGYINHYVGESPGFTGGSTSAGDHRKSEKRKEYVERCRSSLLKLSPSADIRICGVPGRSLVEIDEEFPEIAATPRHLIFESMNRMASHLGEYDYFINIEDDILFPQETFENIVRFDQAAVLDHVFLPNRLESDSEGKEYCVDTYCIPEWRNEHQVFEGRELRVARNPHSGVLVLRADKWEHSVKTVDRTFRGVTVGTQLASAFAHYHSPFKLFRSYSDPNFHVIYHQDRFKGSPNFIDSNHPFHPYGYRMKWEAWIQRALPDAIYRRLKYRGILPRR